MTSLRCYHTIMLHPYYSVSSNAKYANCVDKDLVNPFTDKNWDLSQTLGSSFRVCGSPNPDIECLGHHAGDITFWATVSVDSATGEYIKSYLTNQEVQAAALPRSSKYALPYIYNHFQWSHCSEVGVAFKEVTTPYL